jgi:hypothetical protein
MVVPLKTIAQDLDALEERTARIHWSVHALAKTAGVRPSMLSQWRSGDAVTELTYWRHLRRLEEALAAEELALLRYLKRVAR